MQQFLLLFHGQHIFRFKKLIYLVVDEFGAKVDNGHNDRVDLLRVPFYCQDFVLQIEKLVVDVQFQLNVLNVHVRAVFKKLFDLTLGQIKPHRRVIQLHIVEKIVRHVHVKIQQVANQHGFLLVGEDIFGFEQIFHSKLQQIAVKRADIFYQFVDISSAGPGFGFGVKPVLLVQVMFKLQVFIADLGCDIERFIIQGIKVLIKISLILINSP